MVHSVNMAFLYVNNKRENLTIQRKIFLSNWVEVTINWNFLKLVNILEVAEKVVIEHTWKKWDWTQHMTWKTITKKNIEVIYESNNNLTREAGSNW